MVLVLATNDDLALLVTLDFAAIDARPYCVPDGIKAFWVDLYRDK